MNEIIQIKCPFDGAVLTVKNVPGIESKNVTCPICKHKYPFTEFKRVQPSGKAFNSDPDTEYPDQDEPPTQYTHGGSNNEDTVGSWNTGNDIIGEIVVLSTGAKYKLKPGRNIIGRKASQSGADMKIDTGDKRSMSREHIVIDVKKVPAKGYVHYISLYKEKVNKTTIGNEPLQWGDCIVLENGDIINLPDAAVKFILPDEEGTTF